MSGSKGRWLLCVGTVWLWTVWKVKMPVSHVRRKESLVHTVYTCAIIHVSSFLYLNFDQLSSPAEMSHRKTMFTTRCTYSQCMPPAHLHDLWTNTCGLAGVAHAFGTVGHACAMKCEKCEKEGKMYALRWKSLRMRARFQTAQNTKIWSSLKMTTRFICFARRCCCIYTLSSLPFSRQAPSSRFLAPSFPRSHHNFCYFDVATMRPLVLLQHWEQ